MHRLAACLLLVVGCADPPGVPGVLTSGDVVRGSVTNHIADGSVVGDHQDGQEISDHYTLRLASGEHVVVRAVSDAFSPSLLLWDSTRAGTPETLILGRHVTDQATCADVRAGDAEEMYIAVSSGSPRTAGAYTLRIEPLAPEAAPMEGCSVLRRASEDL